MVVVYKVIQKARFVSLVNEYNPDVICGNESYLDQSFYTS